MIRNTILLLFFFLSLTIRVSSQDIIWDFESTMQGWHDLGAGRDVKASLNNGKLLLEYYENSPTGGPQLWFPAVQVDNLNFNAEDYPYLELHYQAINWPVTTPVKFLITFINSANQNVYSYATIDPKKTAVSIEIAAFDPTWGKPYTGAMKALQLELPHNGDAAANPATPWFSAKTLIDKIVLTNKKNDFLPPKESVEWSFDKDLNENSAKYITVTSGNPTLTSQSKSGAAALQLDGNSFITIPASTVLASQRATFSCWIKTPSEGQTLGLIPRVFSFGSSNFEIAFNQNKPSVLEYRIWNPIAPDWNNNIWQHFAVTIDGNSLSCFLNGKKVGQTINASSAQLRSGNLNIGLNGLKAVIDELKIYNYVLTNAEIAAIGLIPPATIAPWNFAADLQGWHEIQDENIRDVSLNWANGAMVLTYQDKAVNNGPELWMPQVEVSTNFDAELYPYCDIYYQATNWPTTNVKGKFYFTKADGKIATALFNIDPAKNQLKIDIAAVIISSGIGYSGRIASVRFELPYQGSSNPANSWFGASTQITKIEMNNTSGSVSQGLVTALNNAALVKTGLDRLNNTEFQYLPIGLGGTALRSDPWGFAFNRAPNAKTTSWHVHEPYFGYQYWWDKEGHRFNPYRIKSGYGSTLNPGTITAYQQKLEIATGELVTKLNLNVAGVQFSSERSAFVTPEGILVLRVKDTGAPSPLKLKIMVEDQVRIYGNQGIYNKVQEPWVGASVIRNIENQDHGFVVTATRTNTSTAALAVAVDASSGFEFAEGNTLFNTIEPNGTITYFIAPASSYNPQTQTVPWDHAWNAAYAAKQKGYDQLKQETANWWSDYYSKSAINIPDTLVTKLYLQSLYYHGVYFGNTKIPPGCNSTDIESFAGAVCPEYDLTFSQLALLYTGHTNEAKNIADWTYSVLPKAKQNATQGITHHNITLKYSGGAKYTTLMGYDGALCLQPTVDEGRNLYSNYPGANSALMAIKYLDFTNDKTFKSAALDILKSTTQVSLEDVIYDNSLKGYRCKNTPSTVQQASILYGLKESFRQGVAEPGWSVYKDKILIPKTSLNGEYLIAGGAGGVAVEGVGDATWLQHIWWNGVVAKTDPLALPSYKNSAKSTTGDYIFNNGWMGVVAAKLNLGNEALGWLRNYQSNTVYYDQTCFTEARGMYMLTPEIGAHGSYICNLTQMLVDADNDSVTDVFPAIPDEWEYKKIGFTNLLTDGALSFTASRDFNKLIIQITNKSDEERKRFVRINIPRMLEVVGQQVTLKDNFIEQNLIFAPGETKNMEYEFRPAQIVSSIEKDDPLIKDIKIFPNPLIGTTLNTEGLPIESTVRLFNMSGVQLYTGKLVLNAINLPEIKAGAYILNVQTPNGKTYKQLIIKN
jgi:hypothetical protein